MALVTRHAVFVRSQVRFFTTRWEHDGTSSESTRGFSWLGRCGTIVKTLLMTGALVGSYLIDRSVLATDLEAKLPSYPWSMDRGPLSSLDHSSIRRGWHVYRSVCSTCHSIRYLQFQDLVGVSHTEDEIKAIAAEYQVDDGPDDEGNYYKRPGKMQDKIPEPFSNEEAARVANSGALPVDLSFIINARKSGKDYVFSLLTGYTEPPAGVELAEGQLFNVYFPGGAISMPEMIQDGVVDYEDGTPATRSQIAKDIVEFLTWTANRDWNERKVVLMKGIGIATVLLALFAHMNKTRWAVVKTRQIAYVPKRKF